MSKRIISFLFVIVFSFAILSCSKLEVTQKVDIDGASSSATDRKEEVTQVVIQAVRQTLILSSNHMPVSAKPIIPVTRDEEEISVDLVVIGAGGAGITAALEAKSQGLDLIVLEKSTRAGGNTIHATDGREETMNPGASKGRPSMIEDWLEELKEKQVDIFYHTQATKLIMENGKVTGVLAAGQTKDYLIHCKAAIIATGGYGANHEMVAAFCPDYDNYRTVNADGSTGDGIVMAQEVGASIIYMEEIQVDPTVDVKANNIIATSLRDYGAILVNQNGERFFNESSSRDLLSKAIMAQEGEYAYLIFDQQLRERLSVIEDYINRDIVEQSERLTDLAKDLKVDMETLNHTIEEWNMNLASGSRDSFNRSLDQYQPLVKAPYYAIQVSPAIHNTLGGIEITAKAEVVTGTDSIIPGLYAAGEVTGRIQGEDPADFTSEDLVSYSKIAAQSAAIYIKTQYNNEKNR